MKTIILILALLLATFLAIVTFVCLAVCCQRCRISRRGEDAKPKLESWRRLSQSHQKLMATLPRAGEEGENHVGGVDTDVESLESLEKVEEPLYAVISKKHEKANRDG